MFEDPPFEKVDQGSIVEFGGFEEFYAGSCAVVITPRCDIEHKADFVAVCVVADPRGILARRAALNTSGKRSRFIEDVLKAQAQRYHWLEAFGGFTEGAIVDFQLVTAVTPDVLAPDTVLEQLTSPYCEQLCARYAAYMGRVGVPDLWDRPERDQKRNEIVRGFNPVAGPDPPVELA